MDFLEKAQRVFDIELSAAREVRDRLDEQFVRAVELMMGAVDKRNKMVVVGVTRQAAA